MSTIAAHNAVFTREGAGAEGAAENTTMKNRGKVSSARRLRQTIFVRASEEEKAKIYAHAAASNLSASRFLVRGALEGKTPPTAQEREELERLLFLFVRGHDTLGQLLANTRALQLAGADTGIAAQLQELQRTLSALVQHVRKRL